MVAFDIETNIFPTELLEFGAIVLDKFRYIELGRWSTLIHPPSRSVSAKATSIHGLSYNDVRHAPPFCEVACQIFDLLDGRIWVGHNIVSFDMKHIRAAFEDAHHPVPTPHAILDTLPLIRRIFGKTAGDCKMATLGTYFGLGTEEHRAVSDCEMTIRALQCVALHHLLGSELPDAFPLHESVIAAQAKAAQTKTQAVTSSSSSIATTKVSRGTGRTVKLKSESAVALSRSAVSESVGSGVDKLAAAMETQLNVKDDEQKQKDGVVQSSISTTTTAVAMSSSISVSAVNAASGVASSPSPSPPSSLSPSPTPFSPTSSFDPSHPSVPRVGDDEEEWHEVTSHRHRHRNAQAKDEKQRSSANKDKHQRKRKQQQDKKKVLPEQSSNGGSSVASQSSIAATAPSTSSSSASSSSDGIWAAMVARAPGGAAVPQSTPPPAPPAPANASHSSPKVSSQLPTTNHPVTAAAASAPAASPANAWSTAVRKQNAPPTDTASVDPSILAVLDDACNASITHSFTLSSSPSPARYELVYTGGNHPNIPRVIWDLRWVNRPRMFQARIEENRHGDKPCYWNAAKCASIKRIDDADRPRALGEKKEDQ